MVANWMYEEKALNIPEGKNKVIRKALIQHHQGQVLQFAQWLLPYRPSRPQRDSCYLPLSWLERATRFRQLLRGIRFLIGKTTVLR